MEPGARALLAAHLRHREPLTDRSLRFVFPELNHNKLSCPIKLPNKRGQLAVWVFKKKCCGRPLANMLLHLRRDHKLDDESLLSAADKMWESATWRG